MANTPVHQIHSFSSNLDIKAYHSPYLLVAIILQSQSILSESEISLEWRKEAHRRKSFHIQNHHITLRHEWWKIIGRLQDHKSARVPISSSFFSFQKHLLSFPLSYAKCSRASLQKRQQCLKHHQPEYRLHINFIPEASGFLKLLYRIWHLIQGSQSHI